MDHYLGFTKDKYSWKKFASKQNIGELIENGDIETVTLESDGENVYLKIRYLGLIGIQALMKRNN